MRRRPIAQRWKKPVTAITSSNKSPSVHLPHVHLSNLSGLPGSQPMQEEEHPRSVIRWATDVTINDHCRMRGKPGREDSSPPDFLIRAAFPPNQFRQSMTSRGIQSFQPPIGSGEPRISLETQKLEWYVLGCDNSSNVPCMSRSRGPTSTRRGDRVIRATNS